MTKCIAAILGMLFTGFASAEVLIVADEFPAMDVLAARLKADERIESKIVAQTNMPASLSDFAAVVVYIHRNLNEPVENALIQYARAGGKLIVLHHSISSGKRKNKQWFAFLGVSLPEGDVSQGGYKWIEPVTLDFVNLAPDHFIMTNRVQYPAQYSYTRSEGGGRNATWPGFTLRDSEVYLNHMLVESDGGPRKILMGFKYTDAKSGKIYMQDRAGWFRPAGKGWIVYFLPGHSALDFQDPAYARILLNAVIYQP
jgi:hypothetical protein